MTTALLVVALLSSPKAGRGSSWYDEREARRTPLPWDASLCRGFDCQTECKRKRVAASQANKVLAVGQCADDDDDDDERFREEDRDDDDDERSSVECYDSLQYSGGGESVRCELCPRCSSRLANRICVYRNLYFDGAHFLFLGRPGNATCQALLPDFGNFPVRRVAKLPPGRRRSVFAQSVLEAQQLHGAFAHGFLEQLFAAFWLISEVEGSWRWR